MRQPSTYRQKRWLFRGAIAAAVVFLSLSLPALTEELTEDLDSAVHFAEGGKWVQVSELTGDNQTSTGDVVREPSEDEIPSEAIQDTLSPVVSTNNLTLRKIEEFPPAGAETVPVGYGEEHPEAVAEETGEVVPDVSSSPEIRLTPEDKVTLKVVGDGRTLGVVDAYLERQNIFVPLRRMMGLMGLSYSHEEDSDVAVIVLKDGSSVIMDFQKNEFVENNKHHAFYYYDIYRKGDNIYVNTELINRLLPQGGLVVDFSLQQIFYMEGRYTVPGGAGGEALGQLAPAPQAAPVQPVIIDDLTGHPRISGSSGASVEPQAEAKDVLHIETQAKGAEEPSSIVLSGPPPKEAVMPPTGETKEGEEEVLILQPAIKSMHPSDEFIETLDVSGRVFLPLADVVHLFEFPIIFDMDNKTASGFFLTSENTFSLDADKHDVRVGGKSMEVSPNDIRRHEGRIYVSSERFAEWFGITPELDRQNSILHFVTDKKLPQEEKEERQRRWDALLRQLDKGSKDYPIIQNPYHDFSYPAIDVNISSLYTHTPPSETSSSVKTKSFTSNYNIQGSGDIAQLTGTFYAQGSTDGRALDNLRFQAGRKDPNSNLLGPLKATEFELGDVTSPSLSLITGSSLGRGAMITNRDVGASENFDFRNFVGDSVPGYEAELYRNDVLLAFQAVDLSGRYSFTNIPILYGNNIFRLVFYGPQGQREERVETISAASSLLKENKFVYTFGLEQRGESLIPVGRSRTESINTPNGTQTVADFRYGLTPDVTVGASLAETKLVDGEHWYTNTSVGLNLGGVLAEGNFARDMTNNGWAESLTALGGIEGVSLRTRYRKFNNFMSEAVNSTDQPLTSDASLDANTQFLLPYLGSYSTGLSALRETFVDTSLVPRYTYSWRSSKSILGISFTDSFDYVIDSEKRLQDTFSAQTRLLNTDFRAIGIMDMKPTHRMREASFMADYALMDKLTGQTQYDRNMINGQTTYGQNFSWDFDDFRLSFTGQLSSNNSYSVGLNFIFSADYDKATNSWHTQPRQTSSGGSVSGRVYIDENNNGKMDDGEKAYADANIKVNHMLVKPDADDFFAAPIPPYQDNHIELDVDSVADPLLTPVTKDFNVITRPGDNVVVDIPLVRTTIIDGTVVFLDDKGEKHELANIVVELEDALGKPIRRVLSAVDGYFSFDKVQIGEYLLSVPDEVLNSINAVVDKKVSLKIDKIDEFMTDNEIALRQKAKLDGPPSIPMPPKPDPSKLLVPKSDTPKPEVPKPDPSSPLPTLPQPPSIPKLQEEGSVSETKENDPTPASSPDEQ